MKSSTFFPRHRSFWIYHLIGLLAVASIDSFTILFAPHLAGFKLWSGWVLWPPLFTLATLGFRWLYQHKGLNSKSVLQLVPVIIIYSAICAVIVSITICGFLLPVFWQDFVPSEAAASGDTNLLKLGLPIATGAALSGQVFIVAWAFIYVSIIQNRKARERELQAIELQNSLKEAQLSTLQNQLNPHFLFNALNNIRFVIHEDATTADRMLTALSELLRYSLSTSEQTKVLLSKELAMTQRYVDLIKLQYEDKLQFELIKQLDDNFLYVPPMSVQTLVENAVKHGLELLPKGGKITLEITNNPSTTSMWCLSVSNPVPEKKAVQPNNNTGTGLKNIRRRIALVFGEQAELKTEALPNQFIAQLTLPKEE